MKPFYSAILLLLSVAIVVQAVPPKSQGISSYTDRNGQHPSTTTARGPGTITCVDAEADIASQQQHNTELPQYQASCAITAPGFSGTLTSGQSAAITGPGIVVLTCRGQGRFITCQASIKY